MDIGPGTLSGALVSANLGCVLSDLPFVIDSGRNHD